jgi:ribonuclease P protein component
MTDRGPTRSPTARRAPVDPGFIVPAGEIDPTRSLATVPDTLRTGREFRAVFKGRRVQGRLMVVYVLRREHGLHVGFVCGRRVGGAVERNRGRRLLKEAWRTLWPQVGVAADVVFVGTAAIREVGLREVRAEMEGALAMEGLVRR